MAKRRTQSFDGIHLGILQRLQPRSNEPGFLDEALNVRFQGGSIQKRPGIRPFHGTPTNGPIRGMSWHVRPDGTRELLFAAGATLQRCVLNGDPIDIPLTNLPLYDQTRTEQQVVKFIPLSGGTNTTFIFDGVNTNVKWDGAQLTKMGLPNGPTPAAPTPASGTIVAGTRRWVITLVSPYHEGDISVAAYELTSTGSKSFTFASPVQTPDAVGDETSIATAAANNQYDDPQVTQWRLWRTVDAGAQLRFVGEADIGVDITDNVSDDELGGSDLVEQLRNGPPQAPIVAMVEHRGQLIAVMNDDRNLLRFSNFDPDYMVPEGWPRNQVQPVAHADGDEITVLRSFHDWCLVYKSNSLYAVVGDTFTDYRIVPVIAGDVRAGIGTSFPGATKQIDNMVFFASRDGFYRIDRSGDLQATRISKQIDDLYSAVNFSLGSASVYDRKHRIFVFFAHG